MKKKFNLEAFNHLMEIKPNALFSDTAIYTERCRVCAGCQYLATDFKCSKSTCTFYKDVLFNKKGKCPEKKW